ncbi:MAG: glycosyltransferase, partial [Armatimonadota bacterium]|nr:glycosyltransferase [Armatimonadota bacterium]
PNTHHPTPITQHPSPITPRVSVVLPVFNGMPYLPQAVESLIGQTFEDFELIIVNDGSTDGSREYLDSLDDQRVRIIHQENQRLPAALNAGFAVAKGELLTWISADNYCAPEFLETFIAALDAHPEAAFAYSAFAWVDDEGRIFDTTSDQNLAYNRILAANPGVASFMYRRECMEEIGLYDTELEGAEDWDMWLRIVERFQTIYVPDALYCYRTHDRTMTAEMPERIRTACRKAFEKALARKNNDIDLVDLFPAIELCRDQQTAQFHACFDFGLRLLRSPFDAKEEACDFLRAAVELDPDSESARANLAAAYGLAGQWEKALSEVESLKDSENQQVRDICRAVLKAQDEKNPELVRSAALISLDKRSLELFVLENKQRLVFTPQSTKQSDIAPKMEIEPSDGYAQALPRQVHFLMNDKCNAKCVMCGGDYHRSKSGRTITLDKFKRMAANLKLEKIGQVCLAGAGDPLLNPDLVPIIRFINEEYPGVDVSITTNGIALTEELSEQLLGCNFSFTNISINSATRETFKRIMQVDCFEKVRENVGKFVEIRNRLGSKATVRLSSAINRLNIEELPKLVELTHELGADAVNTMYCRFYPESIRHLNVEDEGARLSNEDSLFYHQAMSDTMVEEAKALAAKHNIAFAHEPLFKKNAEPRPCSWPYAEIMVGFDGEIYPCGGAELHFKDKVESNTYHLGNALSEAIDEFWNNETYRKLRISAQQQETCFIPECRCCANVIKPNESGCHIMNWDETDARSLRETIIEPELSPLTPTRMGDGCWVLGDGLRPHPTPPLKGRENSPSFRRGLGGGHPSTLNPQPSTLR